MAGCLQPSIAATTFSSFLETLSERTTASPKPTWALEDVQDVFLTWSSEVLLRGGYTEGGWNPTLPSLEGSWSLMVPTSRSFWSSSFLFLWKSSSSPRFIWRQYYGVLFSVFPKFIYQLDGRFKYLFFNFQPYLGKISILTTIFFKGVGSTPNWNPIFLPSAKELLLECYLFFSMLQGCHRWRITTN